MNMRTKILVARSGGALLLAITNGVAATDADRYLVNFGKKSAPYYASRPLTVRDPSVTRAVIAIHGSSRNAGEYFDAVVRNIPRGSRFEEDWQTRTLVLAPHFQEKDDAGKREHYWKGEWSAGGDSDGLSSYEVVDTLVARLRGGTFPNLKWIVITGHSAGGQFVQRYAAFTDIDLQPTPDAALVKFVPANPSSYVYLNRYRFDETQDTWVIPRGKKNKDYDEYKYGLDDLEDYAEDRGATWARTHFPKRWVEVLAGTEDVEVTSSFDDSREAFWQGDSRFERALRYEAFMDRFFAPNRFTVTPVPRVGHDHESIYASREAKQALYFPDEAEVPRVLESRLSLP